MICVVIPQFVHTYCIYNAVSYPINGLWLFDNIKNEHMCPQNYVLRHCSSSILLIDWLLMDKDLLLSLSDCMGYTHRMYMEFDIWRRHERQWISYLVGKTGEMIDKEQLPILFFIGRLYTIKNPAPTIITPLFPLDVVYFICFQMSSLVSSKDMFTVQGCNNFVLFLKIQFVHVIFLNRR